LSPSAGREIRQFLGEEKGAIETTGAAGQEAVKAFCDAGKSPEE